MSHNVGESSALEKLHDDPQLVSHQVAVVHVHHVLVMVVPHDHHLKHTERPTLFPISSRHGILAIITAIISITTLIIVIIIAKFKIGVFFFIH